LLQAAITSTGETVTLVYDPMGNRIRRTVSVGGNPSQVRKYEVDTVSDLPVILCEIDAISGSLAKTYVYAHSQILAQHDGGVSDPLYFYFSDRQGSVRMVVDPVTAGVQHLYTYDPFGTVLEHLAAPNAPANAFLYTGQWYDEEIGQYFLRARQYDPALMRFTTRDPVTGGFEDPLTLHRYLYCLNDPVTYVDRSGAFFTLPDLSLSTALQMSLRGWGAYDTCNRIKGYAQMVADGANWRTLMMNIAVDAAVEFGTGAIIGAGAKLGSKLFKSAMTGIQSIGKRLARPRQ
jgi:RHS repeat-associated protein